MNSVTPMAMVPTTPVIFFPIFTPTSPKNRNMKKGIAKTNIEKSNDITLRISI